STSSATASAPAPRARCASAARSPQASRSTGRISTTRTRRSPKTRTPTPSASCSRESREAIASAVASHARAVVRRTRGRRDAWHLARLRRLEHQRKHLVDALDEVHLHLLAHVLRHVVEIALVARRHEDLLDPRAVRREELLFDPPDGKDVPAQRDLS